jgi:hypothetical protein
MLVGGPPKDFEKKLKSQFLSKLAQTLDLGRKSQTKNTPILEFWNLDQIGPNFDLKGGIFN